MKQFQNIKYENTDYLIKRIQLRILSNDILNLKNYRIKKAIKNCDKDFLSHEKC